MTIGIFDSGVGGLGIFKEISQLMPDEQILYLADSANCPYGDKSIAQIKQICLHNSRFLADKGADIIVVACNTGSTTALKYVRDKINTSINTSTSLFPLRKWKSGSDKIPNFRVSLRLPRAKSRGLYPRKSAPLAVVGVVPVVKTCSEVSENKRVGILATKRTMESPYLRDLVNQYCPESDGFRVYYQAANELVELVENYILQITDYKLNRKSKIENLKSTSKNLKLIENYLQLFKDKCVDTVALGCTHFPFLRPQIEEILGPKVKVLDSNGAVARQVARTVISHQTIDDSKNQILKSKVCQLSSDAYRLLSQYSFFTTGNPQKLQIQIKNLIGLEVSKVKFIKV